MKVRLPGLGDSYLDEDFVANVQTFVDEAKKLGVDLQFNSAYRTEEYQKSLSGDPSAITPAVTSLHSAGLAVDVNFSSLKNISGGLTGMQQRSAILKAAKLAGLSWGGNFNKKDPPHFYIDPGTDRRTLINNATKRYQELTK